MTCIKMALPTAFPKSWWSTPVGIIMLRACIMPKRTPCLPKKSLQKPALKRFNALLSHSSPTPKPQKQNTPGDPVCFLLSFRILKTRIASVRLFYLFFQYNPLLLHTQGFIKRQCRRIKRPYHQIHSFSTDLACSVLDLPK